MDSCSAWTSERGVCSAVCGACNVAYSVGCGPLRLLTEHAGD